MIAPRDRVFGILVSVLSLVAAVVPVTVVSMRGERAAVVIAALIFGRLAAAHCIIWGYAILHEPDERKRA